MILVLLSKITPAFRSSVSGCWGVISIYAQLLNLFVSYTGHTPTGDQ